MYFYAIVSIVLGALLLGFSIKLNTNKVYKKSIPFYIIALVYIGLGVYGFFIPKEIDYVIIIAMIVICIITLITFNLLFKKENNKNSN